MYLLIPNSYFILPPTSPLVTISMFSMPVRNLSILFRFCHRLSSCISLGLRPEFIPESQEYVKVLLIPFQNLRLKRYKAVFNNVDGTTPLTKMGGTGMELPI